MQRSSSFVLYSLTFCVFGYQKCGFAMFWAQMSPISLNSNAGQITYFGFWRENGNDAKRQWHSLTHWKPCGKKFTNFLVLNAKPPCFLRLMLQMTNLSCHRFDPSVVTCSIKMENWAHFKELYAAVIVLSNSVKSCWPSTPNQESSSEMFHNRWTYQIWYLEPKMFFFFSFYLWNLGKMCIFFFLTDNKAS